MASRTLREVADNSAIMSPTSALEVAQLIIRQLPDRTAIGTVDLDQTLLHDDGSVTVITPEQLDGVRPSQSARFGELLVFLMLGRPALNPQDAFEPVVQQLPNSIVALISRDLSDADGQWVTQQEWLSTLTKHLGDTTLPLTPGERKRHTRHKVFSILGTLLVAALSALIVFYALTAWASS